MNNINTSCFCLSTELYNKNIYKLYNKNIYMNNINTSCFHFPIESNGFEKLSKKCGIR